MLHDMVLSEKNYFDLLTLGAEDVFVRAWCSMLHSNSFDMQRDYFQKKRFEI